MTIRRFQTEDQKPVCDVISGIMNGEFREEKTAYPSDDLAHIPRSYGGLGEAFFVAARNGKIVGTVAVKKEDERVALMRRLFVAPDYRRQQIGLKLIGRALRFCGEMGYQEVVFKTTSRMEGAIKTCEKCGFVPRAKLRLGTLELLKFSLSLKNGLKASQKNRRKNANFRRQKKIG